MEIYKTYEIALENAHYIYITKYITWLANLFLIVSKKNFREKEKVLRLNGKIKKERR